MTDTLIIDVVLSVNPTVENQIKIFPNPTNNLLVIDLGNYASMSGYSLKIVNDIGQQIFGSPVNLPSLTVDLNQFGASGLYFVQVINPFSQVVVEKKIVLQ